MRILELALKDLSQILRDKRSFLFLLAMPVIFTFFMGFAMRNPQGESDPRLALGWVNQDTAGVLSQNLHQVLLDSSGLRLVELAPDGLDQAGEQVSKGKLAGVLVVPPDFSNRALAGEAVQLVLIADEFSNTGQSLLQMVRTPTARLMSAVEIANLDVEWLDSKGLLVDAAARQGELQAAFSQAAGVWASSADKGAQLVVEKARAAPSSTSPWGDNPYNQTSPGILVQFAIFGLVSSANILVQERKNRTLERLMTTSMKRAEIIAGHLLAMFVIVFAQEVLLVVFGQLFLHVDYLQQPLAVLLVAIGLGLWVASLGLLISVLAKVEERVILYTMIAMFVFSALGGTWFPLEGTGALFSQIGHLTPGAWAMDGFQNILVRGLGLNAVLLPFGILVAYALGTFGLAVWQFRAE